MFPGRAPAEGRDAPAETVFGREVYSTRYRFVPESRRTTSQVRAPAQRHPAGRVFCTCPIVKMINSATLPAMDFIEPEISLSRLGVPDRLVPSLLKASLQLVELNASEIITLRMHQAAPPPRPHNNDSLCLAA